MNNDAYKAGGNDARNHQLPANMSNALATVRNSYNAGYEQEKQRQNRS